MDLTSWQNDNGRAARVLDGVILSELFWLMVSERGNTASEMLRIKRFLPLILWSLAFAVAGCAARYVVHNRLETRYLVILFCLAAGLLEWVRPARKLRRDLVPFMLNSAAATVAIVAMKWMLEGVHPLLRLLIERMD